MHLIRPAKERAAPVMIHAPVESATLTKPLLNASFSLGLKLKLFAPPVTDMTKLGTCNFHFSVIKRRISVEAVSSVTRMYYKKGENSQNEKYCSV